MTHWTYDPTIDPLEYGAFIYKVTNKTTGEFYLGWKPIYNFKAKKIYKESDWATYTGSSKTLGAQVASLGIGAFDWQITKFCVSPFQARREEAQAIIKCDGLTNPLCMNGNVMISVNHKMIRGFLDPVRVAKYMADIKKQRIAAGLLEKS
jgi:hypothetical protein